MVRVGRGASGPTSNTPTQRRSDARSTPEISAGGQHRVGVATVHCSPAAFSKSHIEFGSISPCLAKHCSAARDMRRNKASNVAANHGLSLSRFDVIAPHGWRLVRRQRRHFIVRLEDAETALKPFEQQIP
jgi:hypothetical protein